ncbi:serine/threonine-protein kinase [Streptomyces sp. NPDC051219]|uniref:serine/threonine-protein kinase n=1 Tax=Streptomyces sp. NPDC051219 TaxID=3155283 RepID=UPI003432A2C2
MEALRAEDPSWIGSYRLLGRLGAGGMGLVYLGRSAQGRMAAVKVIHAQLSHDPEFRRRFRAEVRSAQRVDGAWTAPVLDFDTESATPWLATAYVPGLTLHEAVTGPGDRLPERSVWSLAAGLAGALRNIHESGLVHRDLKPSNVMLSLDGPRVIDFGVARAADASVATRTGAVIGSPGYMSPEQVRGRDVLAVSDVFSFGSVLAFAATGRHPFGDSDSGSYALMMRVIEEEPDLEGLSGPLAGLVLRCMAKDPGQRPPLREIAEAATAATAGEHQSTWLPPALTAEIGLRTARLLSLDDPPQTRLDGSQGVHALPTVHSQPRPQPQPPPQVQQPHPHPYPPSLRPAAPRTPASWPTVSPAGGDTRRGRALVPVLSTVCAVAVLATLVMLVKPDDGGRGDDRTADPGASAPWVSSPATAGKDGSSSTSSPTRKPASKSFTYRGKWSGLLRQGGSQDYSVKVDYTGGKVGQRVASVDYPSLGCGGRWILLRESSDGIVVREEITRNSHCLPEVEINVTRSGNDQLIYEITDLAHVVGPLSRNE